MQSTDPVNYDLIYFNSLLKNIVNGYCFNWEAPRPNDILHSLLSTLFMGHPCLDEKKTLWDHFNATLLWDCGWSAMRVSIPTNLGT